MPLVCCQNVALSFAQRDILKNVNFNIEKGDRIGLIGANGSGKTTLFRLITGQLEPTEGNVVKSSYTDIGFVEQHACADSRRTVYGEILSVFDDLKRMEAELEDIHRKVELSGGQVSEFIEKQSALTEEYQNRGGLTYEARAHSCLKGLGFSVEDEILPVSSLSGGQRTKLSLGKLLLSEPELMLLDEPTNHLDISSVEWLEDYLSKFKGAVAVISHDRYFLDRTTEKTLEISGKKVHMGKGSYSVYMKNKELRLESDRREYEKGMVEIKRIEKMIEQQKQFNQERNYITIASKEKQIERIRESLPELPEKERSVKLEFAAAVRSGDEVVIAENLSKSYGDKKLFADVTFKIFRGEKVFLLGPNGCGKSTLLSMIMNKTPKDTGLSRFGHNVQVGYFEQTQKELMSQKTVLSEIYDRFPGLTVPEIRGYLGVFNFKNDEIEKLMCDLSGGERARVALLILILRKPNLLILDEPTNHLDIASREVLEKALESFDGTLLCVSHDRYFVNRIATKILSFSGTEITTLDGNYDTYAEKIKDVPQQQSGVKEKKPNEYMLRKENERNERKKQSQIAKLEKALEENRKLRDELTAELSTPETAADYEAVLSLTARIEQLTAENEELELQWLELVDG